MCSIMCGAPSISTTIRRLKSLAGTTSSDPPSKSPDRAGRRPDLVHHRPRALDFTGSAARGQNPRRYEGERERNPGTARSRHRRDVVGPIRAERLFPEDLTHRGASPAKIARTWPVRAVDAPRTGHAVDVRSMSGRPGRFAAGSDHGRRRFHLPRVRACVSVRLPPRGQARPVQDVPGGLPGSRVRAAAPTRPAPATVTTSRGPRSFSAPSQPARPAQEAKIAFNCPTCGHGYRLDAKLAGNRDAARPAAASSRSPLNPARDRKPGAVVAAAPGRGRPPAPTGRDRPGPGQGADASGYRGPRSARRPGPGRSAARSSPPAAGDSGWWELDSSESIPAATARSPPDARGRRRPRRLPVRGMDRGRRSTTFRW